MLDFSEIISAPKSIGAPTIVKLKIRSLAHVRLACFPEFFCCSSCESLIPTLPTLCYYLKTRLYSVRQSAWNQLTKVIYLRYEHIHWANLCLIAMTDLHYISWTDVNVTPEVCSLVVGFSALTCRYNTITRLREHLGLDYWLHLHRETKPQPLHCNIPLHHTQGLTSAVRPTDGGLFMEENKVMRHWDLFTLKDFGSEREIFANSLRVSSVIELRCPHDLGNMPWHFYDK